MRSEAAAVFDVTSFSRPWPVVHANSLRSKIHIFTCPPGQELKKMVESDSTPPKFLAICGAFYPGLNTRIHGDDCSGAVPPPQTNVKYI